MNEIFVKKSTGYNTNFYFFLPCFFIPTLLSKLSNKNQADM